MTLVILVIMKASFMVVSDFKVLVSDDFWVWGHNVDCKRCYDLYFLLGDGVSIIVFRLNVSAKRGVTF